MIYYPNGKLRESASYADGKLTDERTTYYNNGNRQFNGEYNNGVALSFAQFFPNGKLYYTCVFDTTRKLEIIGNAYDLAGNSTAVNGNGTWVTYADTFKRVFSKGPIVNGTKDGEWKGKLSDTSNTFICIYDKGILVSGTTYLGTTGKTIQFAKEEVEPMFKGGLNAFYKLLATNTKYPKKAKENNIQGKVFLSFTVEKDGKLVDIKVVRGIGGGCDEAAVEALKKTSQPWTPGSQYGLPVRVQYSLPLSFTLKE